MSLPIRNFDEKSLATLIRQTCTNSSRVAAVLMVSALLCTSGTVHAGVDTDNDGLSDFTEGQIGTDPQNPDTDSDGLLDGAEVDAGADPLRPDSDGDTLLDGEEVNTYNTNPTESDSDFDTLPDNEEIALGTDPMVWDSDSGGVGDGTEVIMGSNPLDGADDVQDRDLDNDGIPNEIDGTEDFDGDGLPNQMDLDSDNDGIPDLVEAGGTDSDNNGLFDDPTDANGDGLADTADETPLAAPDTDTAINRF